MTTSPTSHFGKRGASPSPILALLLGALALGSCELAPGAIRLEAEAGLESHLDRILAAKPLPEGWKAAWGDSGKDASGLRLRLAGSEGEGPAGSAAAGMRWLAPALALEDGRFSLSRAEATTAGLVDLEEIVPPRRAAAVQDLWPGEEGYPFAQRLSLRFDSGGRGRIPRALGDWLAAAAAAALEADEAPAALCSVGDIQAGPAESPILAAGGARIDELLRGGLIGSLRAQGLLVGNLEGAVSARGSPNPRKRFLFRMPPGSAKALMSAGFDLVLFANNHAFDYGPEAFEDTLRELQEAGLPSVGAGLDSRAALAPASLRLPEGASLLFLGFASYPRERLGFTTGEAAAGEAKAGINADEEATVAAIGAAAASGETIVVLAHGGDEYVGSPPPYLRARYRRFADAGAALVIGSHPHVLQGVEARGEALIAYSLGNFLFTGLEEPPQSVRSAALSFLMYRGRARGIRILPVIVGKRSTSPDPDAAGAERHFAELCGALKKP